MRLVRPLCVYAALTAMLVLGLSVTTSVAQEPKDGVLVIIDDEATVKEIIPKLTSGAGQAKLERKDVYKEDADGKAALLVTGEGGDGQRFNPAMPDWQWQIVKNPKADDEFRYITFAWKKQGGTGIQLQLHGTTNTWGHRYHAGANEKNWNPSIQVAKEIPEKWTVVTRDLFEDWGEFVLTGVAFTAWSLDHGIWDHMSLHQKEEDPLAAQAVEPKGKLAVSWADLKAK